MNFGARLTEERNRIGLNQKDFSKIGGVSKTSQVNYESGLRSPNVDYLKAIISTGVDVQYIITGVRSVNTSEIGKEETECLLKRVEFDPIEPEPVLKRVEYYPREPEPALKCVEYHPREPDIALKRVDFEKEKPEPIQPSSTEDKRTGLSDRRLGIMQELLDGLDQTQQQEILSVIQEKKRMNEMQRQIEQLIKANPQLQQTA